MQPATPHRVKYFRLRCLARQAHAAFGLVAAIVSAIASVATMARLTQIAVEWIVRLFSR